MNNKTFDEFMGDYEGFIKQDNVEVFKCDKNSKYANFLIEVLKETNEFAAHMNVYEITSWTMNNSMIPSDCELYLHAFVKWDSCSHFYFGEQEKTENGSSVSGYLHLCGAEYIKKHFAVMARVYNKAFEVMGREPEADERLD